MTDLVADLRNHFCNGSDYCRACRAADEIERLTAELKAMGEMPVVPAAVRDWEREKRYEAEAERDRLAAELAQRVPPGPPGSMIPNIARYRVRVKGVEYDVPWQVSEALDERDRLRYDLANWRSASETNLQSCAAFRAEIKRLRAWVDALLNHCDKENGECGFCGALVCPHKDAMHFHHDGCPSCCMAEEALAGGGEK